MYSYIYLCQFESSVPFDPKPFLWQSFCYIGSSNHQEPARASDELRCAYYILQKHGRGPENTYNEFKRTLENEYDPNEDWNHKAFRQQRVRPSPLFRAVLDDNLKLAELLLQYGARIEIRNVEGRTALHEAIVRWRTDIVHLFCRNGADLEAPVTSEYSFGGTALHIAATEGLVDIVQSLLRHGANSQARSRFGWTALDIGILDHQEAVLEELLKSIHAPTMLSAYSCRLSDVSLDAEDGGGRSNIAYHLIEHGVRGSGSKHRNLYLGCLSKIGHGLVFSPDETTKLSTKLIREMEATLMEIAGMPGAILWPRRLCAQCDRFQNQDGSAMNTIFEHSLDYSVLSQFADRGCNLCQLLVESLRNRWCLLHQIDGKRREEFGVSPTVLLRIERKNGSGILVDLRLIVLCGDKIAFTDLGHVQSRSSIALFVTRLLTSAEHLNAAVSATSPSDTAGTGSDRSFAIAKAWLERCIEEHPSCRRDTNSGLPTRVLDVGDESRSPHLYISRNEQVLYAALFYCWGNEASICSLSTNIDEHTRGIPFDTLPKTMADAVIIVRRLGI